ncbi:MAG: L,D-transpeptidase [Polyangiaceae bacterium]|nr:L,D-transpeptidase [Polyangiaceae bacterium]
MRRWALSTVLIAAACTGAHEPRGPKAAADRAPATRASTADATPASAPAPRSERSRELDLSQYFGDGYPPSALREPGTGIGSRGYGTWVQPAPRSGSLPLGSIRVGGSIPLVDSTPLPGNGKCPRFVKVERGFVCAGPRATLDMQSAWMSAGRWTEPAPGTMPYQYALSVGVPMLKRPVPPEKMRWKIGPRERPRMKGWEEGHDELAELDPIVPNGPIPDFLRDGGEAPRAWGGSTGVLLKMFPAGNMIAYTRAFEAFGETWVLSTDLSVIPARGLKRFRVSEFHGVALGSGVELPIAWMRKRARAKWRKGPAGFEESGQSWAVKTWVGLTGREESQGHRRFLETAEPGLFIEKSDATTVEAQTKLPREVRGRGKWIQVHVNRGTLTLYEGPKPVFSTLMSPGKTNPTPHGRYFIESKHHYSSMGSGRGAFWIADVPWTIYFERPFAIHTSYWHEDFGQRKSGGCINLSPLDAKRVFDWAAPELPPGWDTVQADGMGGGTFVLIES